MNVTNALRTLWATVSRWRRPTTTRDPGSTKAAADSPDELRESAVEKGADLGARSTEAVVAPRAAIEHLIALGVREDTERYAKEKGVTTVRFNAGRMLRARSGRSPDEGPDEPRKEDRDRA